MNDQIEKNFQFEEKINGLQKQINSLQSQIVDLSATINSVGKEVISIQEITLPALFLAILRNNPNLSKGLYPSTTEGIRDLFKQLGDEFKNQQNFEVKNEKAG